MSNFGSYSGREFLALKLPKRNFLINSIIREKDSIILVGDEKAGKSILTKQIICSLTSKHPFLDRYEVSKCCKVTYIQLEGELEDTQDRLRRMIKVLDFDPELFHIMFFPPLELHIKESMTKLKDLIQKKHNPDVVIIDPLYFAFSGSLSDDEVVRKFIGNMRILKEELNCALIIVHHTHKMRFNFKSGEVLQEGDNAIFGSKFLKAYPDHTLLLVYDKKREVRILTCGTQRSGDIIKNSMLRLIQPSPLYFEETLEIPTKESVIFNVLNDPKYVEGLSPKQIMQATGLAHTTFYESVKKLIKEKFVIKLDDIRPVIYKVRKDK